MDNMGAIHLSENNMTSSRSKHIEHRHLHIREFVSRNLLAVKYIKHIALVIRFRVRHLHCRFSDKHLDQPV